MINLVDLFFINKSSSNYVREEDEENYLEKIEDRLAKTKEHESEKIKDESKKGTEDILEKQQEKSAHCIDNKGNIFP